MLRATVLITSVLILGASSAFASVIQVAPGDVTVNDTANCSLIDAINAANASQASNVTVGACTPTGTPNGGGDGYTSGNVIELAAGTYTLTGVYTLPATYPNAIEYTAADGWWYGPDGLPPIATNIVIVGNAAGSTIERSTASGTPVFRLFYVGGGESLANYNPPSGLTKLPGPGTLTLVNLTLANGLAEGGDAASGGNYGGGGGGLGAGGAIYNQGSLNLTGDTLTGNQALGGAGTLDSYGGGGGGMGGGTGSSANGLGFENGTLWPSVSAVLGSFGNGADGAVTTNTCVGSVAGVGGGGNGDGIGVSEGASRGGFGGGGGGADDDGGSCPAGAGGFGGGGGAGALVTGGPGGPGGFGGGAGGSGETDGGGGGAGLGGAVFNEGGTVSVVNSSLTANTASGGGGPGNAGGDGGSGFGGALFNLNGSVTVNYSTLAANTVTPGAAISGIAGIAAGDDIFRQRPV